MVKKLQTAISLVVILWLLSSCDRGGHFITDRVYLEKVKERFEETKVTAKNRSEQLFKVFDQDLTRAEEEALMFLYAYMPLSDLADYDGSFFLQNVRSSLAARDTFDWGKQVPEVLFRHFVLPVRVNNENLDSSRWVFFSELKDRIRNLNMHDAVLEVNHWCHEKVTYRGTDGRTSSPLATVKTAFGRCGEESTFTVAALRSVGIPARQCYTPRWAHSDDNHAWVEVWVDGKWHFIGACEPEPELDLAWFTAPAKRAMLVNTNVFGEYEGPEDILVKDRNFTRINILSNYTETRTLVVSVTDSNLQPVDSATVEFQLYNYAEFYPLHKSFTDGAGKCSFRTGMGDLLVWAAKGTRYGYRKVSVASADTVRIILDLSPGEEITVTFDFIPPVEKPVEIVVSDSLKTLNKERLAFEDRTRQNYESTFIDSLKAYRLAETLGADRDTLWHYLHLSRGNWREIAVFIADSPRDLRHLVFPLLENLSEKDLRDVNPEVLADQLKNFGKSQPLTDVPELLFTYVLNPRVDNELLKPFRGYFLDKLGADLITVARENPLSLADWIVRNITVSTTANWGRAPLTPVGTVELGITDPHSRDILFVSLCRSIGIPARLEPGSRIPQFLKDKRWNDVAFEKKEEETMARGTLILKNDPRNDRNPEYYIHYTLEQFKDGFFRSLDFEGSPLVRDYPCQLNLLPGYYLMVTGNRIAGGTVLTSLTFFNLPSGGQVDKVISLRRDELPLPDLGRLNMSLYTPTLSHGAVIAWIDPDKEPTKHFLSDIRLKRPEFEKWPGKIILVFPSEAEMKSFSAGEASKMPANTIYSYKTAFSFTPADLEKSGSVALPLVVFAEGPGTIRYKTEGYRIGIGDDLIRIFRRLNPSMK
jgi:transglutaminase-like putative cysteine protease